MLMRFLNKLIPKNIAGIIGLIEAILAVVRELLMVATRVCTTIIVWTDVDDRMVAWIREKFDEIEDGFEKIKNFFLGLMDG